MRLALQPSGVSPWLMAWRSSSLMRVVGAVTMLASTICPPRLRSGRGQAASTEAAMAGKSTNSAMRARVATWLWSLLIRCSSTNRSASDWRAKKLELVRGAIMTALVAYRAAPAEGFREVLDSTSGIPSMISPIPSIDRDFDPQLKNLKEQSIQPDP
ncbi:hypothetical protein [Ralstonia solanacearum]|uniref:hypothetical protein n=1 Tax=Ralstonia solanacearum TaxID=305 RepID=UPI001F14FE57|nr:hypothetical protein [Ralstonia solanacearum]MCL9843475.1 hypothetical protein [Ralstonia solanacearum]MDB0509448.1 hypothetical protein [Ralstonia solanacearum]MDB0515379.1 hypothetical protein [Ralstonia solanacearum]MDC6304956.1 hypothetical protein [Ralstonia solanacearum]